MRYFVYITTNPARTVLYTGITNDLQARLDEHFKNRGRTDTFAGQYYCYNVVYYETYRTAIEAIEREKQIKRWSRIKKEALINRVNPEWRFLNNTDDFRVGRY